MIAKTLKLKDSEADKIAQIAAKQGKTPHAVILSIVRAKLAETAA